MDTLGGLPSTTSIKRITVQTAVDAAAGVIRDAIINGELSPGERLNERQISASLGLGHPTLRQALMELEHQGLVRKVPRRGSYVAEYTTDDYRKMSEVRIMLEDFALEKVAPRLTAQMESELRDVVNQMAAAADKGDAAKFTDWDVAFHRKAWALAANEYLVAALEKVTFQLFVFATSKGRMSPDELQASARDHKTLLDALCTREPEAVRRQFVPSTARFWTDFFDSHRRGGQEAPTR
jgi:DNA-binding GntR family transcriptional regulator